MRKYNKTILKFTSIAVAVSMFLSGCGEDDSAAKLNTFEFQENQFVAFSDSALKGDVSQILKIDTNSTIIPSFEGMGVEIEPYEWIDLPQERLDQIKEWLAFAKIGTVRSMNRAYWYCTGIDGDEPVFIWDEQPGKDEYNKNSNGNPIDKNGNNITGNVKKMEKLYWLLDFCQENNINVVVGDWVYPEKSSWDDPICNILDRNGTAKKMTHDSAIYAKVMAGYVDYLINERGYSCVKYLNIGNEVNMGNPNYSSADYWATGINNIYNQLKAKGLSDKIQITGPDGGFWRDLMIYDVIDKTPDAVDVLDYHWYVFRPSIDDLTVENQTRLLKNTFALKFPSKKLFYTEMGYQEQGSEVLSENMQAQQPFREFWLANSIGSTMIQMTRGGADSNIFWFLDDCIHIESQDYPVGGKPSEKTRWKYGGLWNSLGSYYGMPEDENPRPQYYIWSTISRAFQKGMRIVRMDNPDYKGVTAMAAVSDKEHNMSIAIVNNSDRSVKYTVKCDDIIGKTNFAEYRMSDGNIQMDNKLLPKITKVLKDVELSEGFDIELAPMSTVVLSTADADSEVKINYRGKGYVVDYMDGIYNMHSYSTNLGFNSYTGAPEFISSSFLESTDSDFMFDNTRIHRNNNVNAELIYEIKSPKDFRVGYYQRKGLTGGLRVYYSADYENWELVRTDRAYRADISEDWRYNLLVPVNGEEIPDNAKYLKIEIATTDLYDDTQVTFFEASSEKLPALEYTGIDNLRINTVVGYKPSLPDEVTLKFKEGYIQTAKVEWEEKTFDKAGVYDLKGKIKDSNLVVTTQINVVENMVDEMWSTTNFVGNASNVTFNVPDKTSLPAFDNDRSRLFRSNSEEEASFIYQLDGAKTITISAFAKQDVSSGIKVYISKDNDSYQEINLNYTKKHDTQDEYSYYEIKNISDISTTPFIKVVLTKDIPNYELQISKIELR